VAFVADLGDGGALHVGVPGSSWTVHEMLGAQLDDYDEHSRVGISWQAKQCGGLSTVVFAGTKDGTRGVWAAHAVAKDSGLRLLEHEALVQVGDTTGGRVVSAVHTWDPVSASGNVVVRVGFVDGSSALLRWTREE
jgi:hypothetical protein